MRLENWKHWVTLSGSLTATRGQERIMEVTPACGVDSEEGVNLIWGRWGNKQVQREVEETGGKKGDKISNQKEKDGLLSVKVESSLSESCGQ